MNASRLTYIVLALGTLPGAAAAQEISFQKNAAPFLTEHCVACHGAKRQESRLRLDQIHGIDAGNRNLWTMIRERVASGEMPPKE